MSKDKPTVLKSAWARLRDGRRRDRERLAVYYYARLLGAGHERIAAARQAAVLIPVPANEFLLSIWPRYRYRTSVVAAMEAARKPPDHPPDLK